MLRWVPVERFGRRQEVHLAGVRLDEEHPAEVDAEPEFASVFEYQSDLFDDAFAGPAGIVSLDDRDPHPGGATR